MASHTIPAGTFFTYSPEIRIRCSQAIDPLVQDALDEEERNPEKGAKINCFMRPSSDEERDGHLVRLQGILRMNDFLRKVEALGKTARLFYHTKDARTWHASDDHPCKMLATNDKWWMLQWDEKHLSRLKAENRAKRSSRPAQLSNHYSYSGEFCLYCNGDYDDKIEAVLRRKTCERDTKDGVWTGNEEEA